jgi:hypothetical protein
LVSARQFDVFANPSAKSRAARPHFVVLQSDQLRQLDSRVVAQLMAPSRIKHFDRLMPVVEVRNKPSVVVIQELGAILVREIPRVVANLEAERYRLFGALDFLFTGI